MIFERVVSEWPEFATYYNLLYLGKAAGITVLLTLIGATLGALLGLALAVIRLTRHPALAPARAIAFAYTETFRRVPFLVNLMLFFFVLQAIFSDVPLFYVAAVTTTLIAAAYLSEIMRAGLKSIHVNQWEAARTMNFSFVQTVRYVVLPQAWVVILPPGFAFFISFIKDTALASHIGVEELTYAGKVLNNKGFSPVLSFGAVMIIYFLISWPLARFGSKMERHLAASRNMRA